jgi:hypothetical protein
MIVLEAFTALLLAAIGGWWLSGAVRTWRGAGRFSTHEFFRVQSAQRKENIDRCAPAVAIALLCCAAVFVCVIFAPASTGSGAKPASGSLVSALGGFAALGFFGFGICAIVIRYFNRPRFLVPPPLRSAPGVATGRGSSAR